MGTCAHLDIERQQVLPISVVALFVLGGTDLELDAFSCSGAGARAYLCHQYNLRILCAFGGVTVPRPKTHVMALHVLLEGGSLSAPTVKMWEYSRRRGGGSERNFGW